MASQQLVDTTKLTEADDVVDVEGITDYRNAAVAKSNEAIQSAQSRASSAQATVKGAPNASTAASETKAAAHDASYTVSERMQGMSVSVQEAAKGAAKSISDTLQYGREKAAENLKVAQENAAVLAKRAKEQAVVASSSAYHSTKDATVQGLTVVGHHAAGATTGVVEGIQDTMGVERVNKTAAGYVSIDDAANKTECGAATKHYTKSSTLSALKVAGDYLSHGIQVTKHAVGGASQGVYEGNGGKPYKDTTGLEAGQKSTPEAAKQAEEQGQHHMQHPVGKQAHDVTAGALHTASTYANHGLQVTQEAAGGVLQGITEHIKKGPDTHAATAVDSSQKPGVSSAPPSGAQVYGEEIKQQTIAALESGAQKMAASADYLKEKVNAAFSGSPGPDSTPLQNEEVNSEISGKTGENSVPLQNEKVDPAVKGRPATYTSTYPGIAQTKPLEDDAEPLLVHTIVSE